MRARPDFLGDRHHWVPTSLFSYILDDVVSLHPSQRRINCHQEGNGHLCDAEQGEHCPVVLSSQVVSSAGQTPVHCYGPHKPA